MKLPTALIDELVVTPGERVRLDRRSTHSTKTMWLPHGKDGKQVAAHDLESSVAELRDAQELLWASRQFAVLVVLQAMDAAGKDGTIKHVMSGVNPQGCRVSAFKKPTPTELAHDFLWRYNRLLPERGEIGIFNRSYYEEVLVVRVHPELLGDEAALAAARTEKFWRQRYEDINAFEHHLHRNGTRIVKVFLHVSREEQRRRFLERLENPAKFWKFSTSDLAERRHWDEYRAAYEDAITATSTPWAPWHIVPADHKYAMRALVGGILVQTVDQLPLRFPEPTPDALAALAKARTELLAD